MRWTKWASTARVAALVATSVASSSSADKVDNDPAANNTLTIEISGIKESEGKMACALFWKNKGFPRKHRRALRRTWVEVEGDTVECVFRRTGLGDYAASVFLDLNGNGKLDTNAIGSPKEPWGVSQNAKGKRFGPPIYKDAKFTYRGGALTIQIELVYD